MANVPCPPYYAIPTYTSTPVYTTNQYIRHYNDWYTCLVGPYCNAPSFLGYSPPGEGEKWTEAWEFVEPTLRFDCNPALETDGGGQSSVGGGLILTKKPTNAPTTRAESPSVISGVVWFDANGDGLQNDPNSALTNENFAVAEKERGSGIGNLRVLLRKCGNDEDEELVGVTYTFPSGQGVNLGKASVFDADYLSEIQTEDYSQGSSGEGDIEAGRIGYYSFKILPNQIPGEFYVVFESPVGFKLTGGSGTYWEVQEGALKDRVLPMVQAGSNERDLQGTVGTVAIDSNSTDIEVNSTDIEGNETLAGNETLTGNETDSAILVNPNSNETIPTAKPTFYQGVMPKIEDFDNSIDTTITNASLIGPVTHSGYYSRSRCISIKTNPMGINQIDAGMAVASWPVTSFQYASFILTLRFYQQNASKRRELQALSLECRNYQKLKDEGVQVVDIWGCETPLDTTPQYDFIELSMEQGSAVVAIMKKFLNMGSGEFSLKTVGLVYQKMEVLEKEKDRVLLHNLSSQHADKTVDATLRRRGVDKQRYLQNAELARLELGFRIRGESEPASSQDLTDVLLQSISDDPTFLLSEFKQSSDLPDYIKIAGAIEARKVLEIPKEKTAVGPGLSAVEEQGSDGALTAGAKAGIAFGVLVPLGLLLAIIIYRRRKYYDDSDSSSSGSSSGSSYGAPKAKAKAQIVKTKFNTEEDYSYESDSLSSRWYSDYEGSDDGEQELEEFDVKAAFYSGAIKPQRRDIKPPSVASSRRSASSLARSSKYSAASKKSSSRRSAASSARTGSSKGSSSRFSRVSSAVSATSSRSSVSSARSGSSRGSSRVGSGVSRVRSVVSGSTRSSSYASRPSKSTRSTSHASRPSTRSSYSSYASGASTQSQSTSWSKGSHSTAISGVGSRYSRASSQTSRQSEGISMSSSMYSDTRASTRSASLQDSVRTTSSYGSRSQ